MVYNESIRWAAYVFNILVVVVTAQPYSNNVRPNRWNHPPDIFDKFQWNLQAPAFPSSGLSEPSSNWKKAHHEALNGDRFRDRFKTPEFNSPFRENNTKFSKFTRPNYRPWTNSYVTKAPMPIPDRKVPSDFRDNSAFGEPEEDPARNLGGINRNEIKNQVIQNSGANLNLPNIRPGPPQSNTNFQNVQISPPQVNQGFTNNQPGPPQVNQLGPVPINQGFLNNQPVTAPVNQVFSNKQPGPQVNHGISNAQTGPVTLNQGFSNNQLGPAPTNQGFSNNQPPPAPINQNMFSNNQPVTALVNQGFSNSQTGPPQENQGPKPLPNRPATLQGNINSPNTQIISPLVTQWSNPQPSPTQPVVAIQGFQNVQTQINPNFQIISTPSPQFPSISNPNVQPPPLSFPQTVKPNSTRTGLIPNSGTTETGSNPSLGFSNSIGSPIRQEYSTPPPQISNLPNFFNVRPSSVLLPQRVKPNFTQNGLIPNNGTENQDSQKNSNIETVSLPQRIRPNLTRPGLITNNGTTENQDSQNMLTTPPETPITSVTNIQTVSLPQRLRPNSTRKGLLTNNGTIEKTMLTEASPTYGNNVLAETTVSTPVVTLQGMKVPERKRPVESKEEVGYDNDNYEYSETTISPPRKKSSNQTHRKKKRPKKTKKQEGLEMVTSDPKFETLVDTTPSSAIGGTGTTTINYEAEQYYDVPEFAEWVHKKPSLSQITVTTIGPISSNESSTAPTATTTESLDPWDVGASGSLPSFDTTGPIYTEEFLKVTTSKPMGDPLPVQAEAGFGPLSVTEIATYTTLKPTTTKLPTYIRIAICKKDPSKCQGSHSKFSSTQRPPVPVRINSPLEMDLPISYVPMGSPPDSVKMGSPPDPIPMGSPPEPVKMGSPPEPIHMDSPMDPVPGGSPSMGGALGNNKRRLQELIARRENEKKMKNRLRPGPPKGGVQNDYVDIAKEAVEIVEDEEDPYGGREAVGQFKFDHKLKNRSQGTSG